MSPGRFFGFLLSGSGAITLLLLVTLWLILRPRSERARACLIVAGLGYSLLSLWPLSQGVSRMISAPFHPFVKEDVPAGPTVVVLLGSSSWTGKDWSGNQYSMPDSTGAMRVLEAARVYKMIEPKWVVSCGGSIDADDPNEPSGKTMQDMLVQLGVPRERILPDVKSGNTHEEAAVVARMLPSLDVEHVVVVTSPLHMRRSLGAFRSVGISAVPAVAREPDEIHGWAFRFLPTTPGLQTSSSVAHELLGLAYYRARGWYK